MISPCLASSSRKKTRLRGFVLVAVLLVVAVVTLLMVVASMLSQIERRAAANSGKIEQARLNALFSLDAAIAQLQREAGPDQRITARAEILDADPATTNTSGVNQPYWTGVWKTGTNGLDVVNSGTPQRQISLGSTSPTTADKATNAVWLVSGTNTSYNPLSFTGVTNAPNADAAVLARNYGAAGTNVIVPLVPMLSGNKTTGAYAYWVSDEGVKAKVNQTTPTLGASSIPESQLHFLAPQANPHGKGILGTSNTADLRGTPNAANFAKVTTLPSLQNVPGIASGSLSGTNSAVLSADASTYGATVLADVRRGGLKWDLTAALEDPVKYNQLVSSNGFGAGTLYRTASSAGLSVPFVDTGITPPTDGLPWMSLFGYYNSYKAAMPAPQATVGTTLTPVGIGNPASLPYSISPRLFANANSNFGGIVPTVIAYRLDVAISSYLAGGLWKLRVHYYPQLVLYNPYSVRLSLANFQYQRNFAAFGTYAGNAATIQGISVGGSAVPEYVVNFNAGTGAYGNRLNLVTRVNDAAVLDPGETRVFALDADAQLGTQIQAMTFSSLKSSPAMSPDYSQWTDLPGFAGTADPNAVVNFGLRHRQLSCNAIDISLIPKALRWTDANTLNPRYFNVGLAGPTIGGTAPATPLTVSKSISQLSSPVRIIGVYLRVKGTAQTSSTYTYINGNNLLPIFMGNAWPLNIFDDGASSQWQELYLSPFGGIYQNGQTDVQIAPSGSFWESSFGTLSAGAAAPGSRIVLRDVPSQPLISLGQFMHMPSMNFYSTGSYQSLGFGSMVVGGSYASPVIPSNNTALSVLVSGGNRLFLDDSFLANQELFDRYFFSTVPPAGSPPTGTTWPAYWTAFNAANTGATLTNASLPLLNTRMKPLFRNGVAPAMADLRDTNKAAANLMLDGGFNVNSTSVEAWKAMLSSLSGTALQVWSASDKALETPPWNGLNPIPRFWSASSTGTVNGIWDGLRALTDAQVQNLAEEIVRQVKTRGPFLSMADFLNRRLGPAGPLTRAGALQAAIDNSSPDINATAKLAGTASSASGGTPPLIATNMQDTVGNPLSTAAGIPGFLMQQDLVQAFSPAMTARSDTFLVRTYGEVRNPRTGVIEGSVWAEAVVQRTPELTDPSQDPEVSQATINTNAVNAAFGRRLKVVSFRWLNEDEI